MLRSLGLAAFGVATGVKVVQHCAETASELVEEAAVMLSATDVGEILRQMYPTGLDDTLVMKDHKLLPMMRPNPKRSRESESRAPKWWKDRGGW